MKKYLIKLLVVILFFISCSKYNREENFVLDVVNNTNNLDSIFKKYQDITNYLSTKPVDSTELGKLLRFYCANSKTRLKTYRNLKHYSFTKNVKNNQTTLEIIAVNEKMKAFFVFIDEHGHFVLDNITIRLNE